MKVIEPYHVWYYCEPECDGTNSEAKVTIVNTQYSTLPIRFRGVMLDVPALPSGKRYRAVGARILRSRDNGDGTLTLQISANMNPPVGYKSFDFFPVYK